MSQFNGGPPTRPATATAANPTWTEGQLVELSTDLNGALRCSVVGGATGGTSAADGSTFTPGNTQEVPIGGIVDDAAPHTVAEGKTGVARITPYRAVHENLRNASGAEVGVLAAPLRTDPTGTTKQPVTLFDGSGNAITSTGGALNISGSITASPASDGVTGSPVPADASYAGINVGGGTLRGQTGANPVGTVYAAHVDLVSLKGITTDTNTGNSGAGTQRVVLASDQPAVATTVASLPLPTGAATSAKQPALGTAGASSVDVISVQGIASGTALPVSAASLPLPSGASTAAKQPALGTAGTASADVITVQGIASMTALKVDGSGVTQPVSGTFWQATQPVSQSAASIPAATTMQNAATGNGNGTNLPCAGYAVAIINIVSSPSMSGGTTVNFEASVDNTTWVAILAHQVGVAGTTSTTTTADGDYRIYCGAYSYLRARISAYSAGTVTVKGYVNVNSSGPTTVSIAGTAQVGGAGAAGAAVAGNPIRSGALGRSTLPTIVASAQLVDILADRYGRLFRVAPICTTVGSNGTPITTNTTTSIVAAPSAGSHIRVHRLWAQNSSATGTWCYWCDGTTKKIPFYLAQYQPFSMAMDGRWELTTATALQIITSTTGASIEWYVEYEVLAD